MENRVPRVWAAKLADVAGIRDSLAHSGYLANVLVLNLPRPSELVGPYRSVFESRPDPNVCFDVAEQSKTAPRWIPGFAELLGLVETGIEVADILKIDQSAVIVIASRRNGEACKIAVAIVSAVVTALAKSKQDVKRLLSGSTVRKTGNQEVDALVKQLVSLKGATPNVITAHASSYYDQVLFRYM